MNIRLLFAFFVFINVFCIAQDKRNYAAYIDSANGNKYKDWKKAERNIENAKKEISEENLGNFYLDIIPIYTEVSHFDTALNYCTKAYQIFEKKNDGKNLAKVNSYFAFIYAQLNDPKRAIKYYKKTLFFYTSRKDTAYIIKSLNNLGNAYMSLSKYDSSEYYLEKSHVIFHTYKNPILNVFVLSNLGKLYFFKKEYSLAENNLLQAENILIDNQIKDHEPNYNTNYNLANFYIQKKNPVKALIYAKKLGKYNDEINKLSFTNLRYLKALYEAHLLNHDYKSSSMVFQKYDSIRDLMNIEEIAVNVERLKAQHEYEIKKNQDSVVQERRNFWYIIILILLIFITCISFLLLYNYKNKTEALNLEKKLIAAREKELEIDNQLKEKMLIHKSMEQQRLDGLFRSTFEKIDSIKSKFDTVVIDDIFHIANDMKVNVKQNISDDFEYHFLQIHESFYKNLTLQHPDLTIYDKKLAAMLKLRLSTKEISNLLNVTPKTIENSRTRLRKKLNLTNTKEDLMQYLDKFS